MVRLKFPLLLHGHSALFFSLTLLVGCNPNAVDDSATRPEVEPAGGGVSEEAAAQEERIRDTYRWAQPIGLHNDNHSQHLGSGLSVEEAAAFLQDLSLDVVQVAAWGRPGTPVNFPSQSRPEHINPKNPQFDTVATWKGAAEKLGIKFQIYFNLMGDQLGQEHPEWKLTTADGTPWVAPWLPASAKPFAVLCAKPAPNGYPDGYLETHLLPLAREIGSRYQPDGYWIDGDINKQLCYCPKCLSAWKAETGLDDAPRNESSPEWAAWWQHQQGRHQAMRESIAAALHEGRADSLIGFNSGRMINNTRDLFYDPRSATDIDDYLTQDREAVVHTWLRAFLLSSETSRPVDTMHLFIRGALPDDHEHQIGSRMLRQMGALTLASGAGWWLWSPGNSLTHPSAERVRARLAEGVAFARDRAAMLGAGTRSRAGQAVLLSETAWVANREARVADGYDNDLPNWIGLSLSEAGHTVDHLNERQWAESAANYETLWLAGNRVVGEKTMASIRAFVEAGGTLVVTGDSLLDEPAANPLLGVERGDLLPETPSVKLNGTWIEAPGARQLKVGGATVVLQDDSGLPLLARHGVGAGSVWYLNSENFEFPTTSELIRAAATRIGLEPLLVRHDAPGNRLVTFHRSAPGSDASLVHLIDLSGTWKGEAVPVMHVGNIDEMPGPRPLQATLRWPKKPTRVGVIPTTEGFEWSWENGELKVSVPGFDVHSALRIE